MAISAVAERAMRVCGLELTSLVGDGSGFVSFQCRRALKSALVSEVRSGRKRQSAWSLPRWRATARSRGRRNGKLSTASPKSRLGSFAHLRSSDSLGSEALRHRIAARRTAAYGGGNSDAASEVKGRAAISIVQAVATDAETKPVAISSDPVTSETRLK